MNTPECACGTPHGHPVPPPDECRYCERDIECVQGVYLAIKPVVLAPPDLCHINRVRVLGRLTWGPHKPIKSPVRPLPAPTSTVHTGGPITSSPDLWVGDPM